LLEEILVDAYNESEQLSSFEVAFDEATFPIGGTVLGRSVVITAVVFDGDERRGLRAVVHADGSSQQLDLLDVDVDESPADTAKLVSAYRRWWVPPS
jgi:hypothetical protein